MFKQETRGFCKFSTGSKRGEARDFFIVESKYSGTSKLKNTKDGPQMGDKWINGSNRLKNALSEEEFIKISAKRYKRILSEVAPDGKIIYKELDEIGKTIGLINL